jgi:hypothetical protein
MAYFRFALRSPTLDDVVHAFSLLHHFAGRSVLVSKNSRVSLLAIEKVSFFGTGDCWLDRMEEMLSSLVVRLQYVPLVRK